MVALCQFFTGGVGIILLFQARANTNVLLHDKAVITAREVAGEVRDFFSMYWFTVESMSDILANYEEIPASERRSFINTMLRNTAKAHENIVGVWTVWEPDVLEGNDQNYLGVTGTTAAGRFSPYWYREGKDVLVMTLEDFEMPSAGDYYLIARDTGKTSLLDPFIYNVNGKDILMTSVASPIRVNGRVVGAAGVDISIEKVEEISQKQEPFGSGLSAVFSNNGTIVAHNDTGRIGKNLLETERGVQGRYIDTTIRAIRNGEEFAFTNFAEEAGVKLNIVFTPVTVGTCATPWSFAIGVPATTLMASIDRMQIVTIFINVIIIGLVIPAAIFLLLRIFAEKTRIDKAKIKADEENRMKTSFLANMSHELRTPLNVVIGLTDLILGGDDNLDERVTENLVKINNAGGTLLSIVNNILDFSKIESGKLELTPVEYYMPSLLNDVITIVVTCIGESPISFRLDIEDDLPAKLYVDDLRVKQILINLLSNAVKYTSEGNIELNVRCTREGGAVWLDITVSDTGIGIRNEDIKRLFSDYNQVDTKANRNIEGTGLGLAIASKMTVLMGGEIRVESEYGKGSVFHLQIRQGYVDDMPIGAYIADRLRSFRYAEDKRIVTKRLARLNLSYARVLVVDDLQTNLDVASGLLRNYKMQVDCIDNGQEAVNRIRGGVPAYNAVFMDHMMPGMDGIETSDAIRALGTEYALKIPIIALTANAIQGTEQMFYEHGFQAFITKPIDVMELDTVIKKWVRDDAHEDVPVSDESPVSDVSFEIEIPGVDTKKGLSLYTGDTKVYLSLLRSYAANTLGVLEKLRSVSAQTLSDYVIAVHGLKGTSASIGAQTIQEAAMNLETISRAGDLQGVLAENGKLIGDTETVVANIKAWLEQYDANSKKKPLLKTPDMELLARLRRSCESYDIDGIDKAMLELESADYEEGADLVAWIRQKIDISKIGEVARRLAGDSG
jgi:signal transduction histidine kinase/CheY-like chemotaxis protein